MSKDLCDCSYGFSQGKVHGYRLRAHLPWVMLLMILPALFFLSPGKAMSSLLMNSVRNTTETKDLKYLETLPAHLGIYFCSCIDFNLVYQQ